MMYKNSLAIVSAMIWLCAANGALAGEKEHGHEKNEAHHEHGEHKGHGEHGHEGHEGHKHDDDKPGMLEVGKGAAKIKFQQDREAGVVWLQIVDAKTMKPMPIAKAPRLNLDVEKGRKQVKTIAVGADKTTGFCDVFEASSPHFKGCIDGVIAIKIAGEAHQVPLGHVGHAHGEHDHGDHKGHEHDGHEH